MIKLCTVCNIISLFMAYVPERKKCSVSSFELPQYWQVGLHLRNLHINVHLSYLHVLILCAKIFSIHILKTFPIINLRKKSVFYRGGVFFLSEKWCQWKYLFMKLFPFVDFHCTSFTGIKTRRNMLYKYLGTDYDRFVTDWPQIYIYIGSISLIDGEVIIYRPDNEVLRDNDKENISYDWRSTSISITIRLCLS